MNRDLLPTRNLRNRPDRRRNNDDVTTGKDFSPTSTAAIGLAPYVPSAEEPWNEARAAHLLRRTGFGVAPEVLDAALAATPGEIVDALLAADPPATTPGTWVNQKPFAAVGNPELTQYYIWTRELQEWWFDMIRRPNLALREKMTLFWHNHFTSEADVVVVAQYLYKQNQLFREFAFGDFKELARRVTTDPAMLIYLDLGLSKAGNPNENYPRELLELFAIGEGTYTNGTPHYTEHDIVELSRALTGWTVDNDAMAGRFSSPRFDSGRKTIFGETANFALGSIGERDVIDLIFDQVDVDYNRKRAAVFLCSKLYRWFVYEVPDPGVVGAMADTLVTNNWNVRAVLRELFTSQHFFSEDVRGALIKSPADFVAGSILSLGLNPNITLANVDPSRPDTYDPVTAMTSLAMTLLDPPNVKGWPGGRAWISSVTAPQRIRYSESWVAPIAGARVYGFDPAAFLAKMPERDDVQKVLDRMLVLLLPLPVDPSTRTRLLDTLLGGGMPYEWDPDHPSSAQRIRSTLSEIARLAEYQLM